MERLIRSSYLLGLTETKNHPNADLADLRLSDEMIDLLKSGRIDTALLCELVAHPDFVKLLADIQIYVEGIAATQIQNLNAWVDVARAEIVEKYQPGEHDKTAGVLQAAHVREGDYFSSRVHHDIDAIMEDIRDDGLWNTRSVKKILTNITYTGVLVQGKKNILIENTHEAIVSKIVFDKVQCLLSGKPHRLETTVKSPIEDNPLKGKVICGNCGGKLQRKRGAGNADWYFFTCITKNRMGAEHCSGMYIRETAVIDAVRTELSNCIHSWEATEDKRKKEQLELRLKIDCLERDLDIQSKECQKIYEDMVLGKINTTEYSDLKSVMPDLKSELLKKDNSLNRWRMR